MSEHVINLQADYDGLQAAAHRAAYAWDQFCAAQGAILEADRLVALSDAMSDLQSWVLRA